MKTIMALLLLGTSVLVANANTDYNKSDLRVTDNGPFWNHRPLPPSQSGDSQYDRKVATYTVVPEAPTIFAAAILLLPLGLSMVGNLRRNKKRNDQDRRPGHLPDQHPIHRSPALQMDMGEEHRRPPRGVFLLYSGTKGTDHQLWP
jgi:hypothetical protein